MTETTAAIDAASLQLLMSEILASDALNGRATETVGQQLQAVRSDFEQLCTQATRDAPLASKDDALLLRHQLSVSLGKLEKRSSPVVLGLARRFVSRFSTLIEAVFPVEPNAPEPESKDISVDVQLQRPFHEAVWSDASLRRELFDSHFCVQINAALRHLVTDVLKTCSDRQGPTPSQHFDPEILSKEQFQQLQNIVGIILHCAEIFVLRTQRTLDLPQLAREWGIALRRSFGLTKHAQNEEPGELPSAVAVFEQSIQTWLEQLSVEELVEADSLQHETLVHFEDVVLPETQLWLLKREDDAALLWPLSAREQEFILRERVRYQRGRYRLADKPLLTQYTRETLAMSCNETFHGGLPVVTAEQILQFLTHATSDVADDQGTLPVPTSDALVTVTEPFGEVLVTEPEIQVVPVPPPEDPVSVLQPQEEVDPVDTQKEVMQAVGPDVVEGTEVGPDVDPAMEMLIDQSQLDTALGALIRRSRILANRLTNLRKKLGSAPPEQLPEIQRRINAVASIWVLIERSLNVASSTPDDAES